MKKKPIVDTYDPVIYPRKLWVTTDVIGLNKIFTFCKMLDGKTEESTAYSGLLDEYEKGSGQLITCPVIQKSTGCYGVLVIVLDLSYEAGGEAHEAVHVADYMFEQLGMYAQDFSENNEQYAYLVGWAAGCISKTIINRKKNDA